VPGPAAIGHDEPEVGAERSAHERLAIERCLSQLDRSPDEVEEKDGLADRGMDRLLSLLS
jgi:hypothetical protein